MHFYACVHTPMGLPTGSSQAEDFRTEQLSACTQSREMTLQQEELFNLSRVKNHIQDEACVFVVPVSSCSWFFSLTSLVASLVLLWWVCWQYALRTHLKEARQYQKDFGKKASKELCSFSARPSMTTLSSKWACEWFIVPLIQRAEKEAHTTSWLIPK